MTTEPTRCCVLTQKGTRCANEPSPVRPSRMIGPVRIAACGLEAHQRALWSLPGFVRHDAYCGAFGCDRPSNAGICPKHRDQYRDFGITEYALLAQGAPMTEPITPPAAPQEAADGEATPKPACTAIDGEPCVCFAREGDCPHMPGRVDYTAGIRDRATAPGTDGESDGEPSMGDVDDALDSYPGGFATSPPAFGPTPAPADEAPLFVGGTDSAPAELVARWAQVHTAPMKPMPADLDGLAAIAARGQPPTAPGSTVAELQQQLAAERARADLLDAEAVSQRQRAEAVEAELFEVDRTLQHLGAYGNGPTIDRLLKVLTPEDRRAILELQAAEARMDLARLKARRLNPAPPEKLAEYAAKVAALNARIAALDAG